MKMVICGLWHVHAPQYCDIAQKYTEVIGVWDENEQWRRDFCEKRGLHEFKSLDELLSCGADAAIVCTSTDTHADVMVKLANAKMDIFTEKVLALTEADCERVEKAVKENGVKFVISLPQKYWAGQRTVKAIIDSGELGKINYYRYRNVHSGSINKWLPAHFYNEKQCGGGAMIDLGAHGMYVADWLLGVPVSASSVFTIACDSEHANAINPDRIEDNAVTVMRYENGAIAINETGFCSVGCPITLEVGGELGYVTFTQNGKVIKNTTATEGKPVEAEMLEALPQPCEQFCTGKILEGCGIQEAKRLTHLMVLAYSDVNYGK
ncbi:MAG: Gfo/Idh/MocA family oxidoreductase [Clostridia bacterium]|nr:Gfo/Idh/MocA family oxidoreductase [Clostridia bacterium]